MPLATQPEPFSVSRRSYESHHHLMRQMNSQAHCGHMCTGHGRATREAHTAAEPGFSGIYKHGRSVVDLPMTGHCCRGLCPWVYGHKV